MFSVSAPPPMSSPPSPNSSSEVHISYISGVSGVMICAVPSA